MGDYNLTKCHSKETFRFSIKELESPEILSVCSTPHSRVFISNCLLEAVKAKLRNWKDVKIIYIPSWLNPNRKHPNHFLWINKKTNLCYEFTTLKPFNQYKLPLTFMRGCISVHSIKYYNDYMNRFVKVRCHQLEDRLMLKNQIFEALIHVLLMKRNYKSFRKLPLSYLQV